MLKQLIDEALKGWMSDGEVIAEREFPSGTKIVVLKDKADAIDGGSFSMYRAFGLGEHAEVSADVQYGSAGDVAAKLLSLIPEGHL